LRLLRSRRNKRRSPNRLSGVPFRAVAPKGRTPICSCCRGGGGSNRPLVMVVTYTGAVRELARRGIPGSTRGDYHMPKQKPEAGRGQALVGNSIPRSGGRPLWRGSLGGQRILLIRWAQRARCQAQSHLSPCSDFRDQLCQPQELVAPSVK
jgi:hypothetical protein